MHLPFEFVFDPTPGGSVQFFSFISALDNLILAGLSDRAEAQLAATNMPADTAAFWITGFALTLDSPAILHIAYEDTGGTKHILYPIVATLGGNGGMVARFSQDGIFIPQKARLRVAVPAAYTANGSGIVGGHLEVYPRPTGHS